MSTYNFDDVIKIIENFDYILLEDKYINSKTKMSIVDKFGYKYSLSLNHFYITVIKRKTIPSRFEANNPYIFENIKLWISTNNKNFELIDGVYIKAKSNSLIFLCNKCGEKFNLNWGKIYSSGQGCPYCAGKRISESNCFSSNYPDISIEWNYSKNLKHPQDYASFSHKKVWWICSRCNNEWEASICSRTHMESGCPKCCLSHGEKKIMQFLNKNDFEYHVQHKFINCKDIFDLPFDFYLPNLNAAIEYDGELHYHVHRFIKDPLKAEKVLDRTKRHDVIKTEYCKNNNINLIRIPFWEFDNIENILQSQLLSIPIQ